MFLIQVLKAQITRQELLLIIEKYRGISEYFWKLYLEKIVVIQFAKHRVAKRESEVL